MDFNVNTETEEQALINSVHSTLTEQGDVHSAIWQKSSMRKRR